jgi:hypothetical protein
LTKKRSTVEETSAEGAPVAADNSVARILTPSLPDSIPLQLRQAQVNQEERGDACVVGMPAAMITPPGDAQIGIAAGVIGFHRLRFFQTDRPSGCRPTKGCPRSTGNGKKLAFLHALTHSLMRRRGYTIYRKSPNQGVLF